MCISADSTTESSSTRGVFSVWPSGSGARRLLDDSAGEPSEPQYSPNGRRIIYTRRFSSPRTTQTSATSTWEGSSGGSEWASTHGAHQRRRFGSGVGAGRAAHGLLPLSAVLQVLQRRGGVPSQGPEV